MGSGTSGDSWRELMTAWSRDLVAAHAHRSLLIQPLAPDVAEAGWLGFPGATEEEISTLELRLGATLPPSYKAFLHLTNGWRQLDHSIYQVWPTQTVDWFRVRNQDWIDGWLAADSGPPVSDDVYFVYGDQQDCINLRPKYLQSALEISSVGDSAILLLNPDIVSKDGEWEAWFFANWLPGAERFPSFKDMMTSLHTSFHNLVEEEGIGGSSGPGAGASSEAGGVPGGDVDGNGEEEGASEPDRASCQ